MTTSKSQYEASSVRPVTSDLYAAKGNDLYVYDNTKSQWHPIQSSPDVNCLGTAPAT